MSRKWNPMSFTVAQFGERLAVSYDAALHLLSALADAGMATRLPKRRDDLKERLVGKGATLWRLHSRAVKNRTGGPDNMRID